MKPKHLTRAIATGLICLSLQSHAGYVPSTGFVLLAEHRFDPAVQRMLAERSLKALPIRHGELFYIIPVNTDPRVEAQQIQYLEYLLDKDKRSNQGKSTQD